LTTSHTRCLDWRERVKLSPPALVDLIDERLYTPLVEKFQTEYLTLANGLYPSVTANKAQLTWVWLGRLTRAIQHEDLRLDLLWKFLEQLAQGVDPEEVFAAFIPAAAEMKAFSVTCYRAQGELFWLVCAIAEASGPLAPGDLALICNRSLA